MNFYQGRGSPTWIFILKRAKNLKPVYSREEGGNKQTNKKETTMGEFEKARQTAGRARHGGDPDVDATTKIRP